MRWQDLFRTKPITRFLEQEEREPAFSWALRMAVVSVLPIVWGLASLQTAAAEWVALTAECICWVELKGSFTQRARTIIGGGLIALAAGIFGSITGHSLWMSISGMLLVGFISGLFKNLGDRGSGLAICVFVMFLIGNAMPVTDRAALGSRILCIIIGAGWNGAIGMAFVAFMPAQQPYRRSIAILWQEISKLARSLSAGLNGKGLYESNRKIYLNQKAVRTALDASISLHSALSDDTKEGTQEHRLAQTRKIAALIAAICDALADEIGTMIREGATAREKLLLYDLMQSIAQLTERLAVYTSGLRAEEALLLESRLDKFDIAVNMIHTAMHNGGNKLNSRTGTRILQLTRRADVLFRQAYSHLRRIEDEPIYRSYSVAKALVVLHPVYWYKNIRPLFSFRSHILRYAIRMGVATAIGMALYKYLRLDHGYWLPFTVIILLQPYFGDTLRKSLDRIIGTATGGLLGGLFLYAHFNQRWLLLLIFAVSAFGMVWFSRKRYSIASVFVTLNLVLLFSITADLQGQLILSRLVYTLGGAAIAIASGFLLLPYWDKTYLPRHVADAVAENYKYFLTTMAQSPSPIIWTRFKRMAEMANSVAYDSFSRYVQEPATSKKRYKSYYQLITLNVRITRHINSINLQHEAATLPEVQDPHNNAHDLFDQCARLFAACNMAAASLRTRTAQPEPVAPPHRWIVLNDMQLVTLRKLHTELTLLLNHLKEYPGNNAPKAE